MDELLAKLERRTPLAGLLGYVNFAAGKPDARFRHNLSDAYAVIEQHGEARPYETLERVLRSRLQTLNKTEAAFRDSTQAEAVLELVFQHLLPAYRQHHQDLLFHQTDENLFTPYFLAVAMEAVLAQGGPWNDKRRIVAGALGQLNDFVGHRPIAILETRPRGEPYEQERVRPVPLWLRGAGAAWGRYRELVGRALEILSETEPAVLNEAGFDLEALEELAFDPRAYDHGHPANRRPNYVFGEWDPHQIDGKGRYRRYVARQVTLDGLLDRVEHTPQADGSELLFEAAAVLAGTIMMGTGISGSGPGAHDSSITLATLMPSIARLRDQFYAGLLKRMRGPQADRLRAEAEITRQPFGGMRQHLNQFLARHRAAQLQQRHLALFYADLGYAEASRRAAAGIPAASMRMLSEMHSRIRTSHLHIDRGEFPAAIQVLQGLVELLQRGIACGALLDPWNILGFQGLFPLSSAREDSIRDPRVDELVELLDSIFHLCARLIAEMAAAGQLADTAMVRAVLQQLAQWWDRFASVEVNDVRRLHGGEILASTDHLASTLARWHERGETAADLAFWREHLDGFQTPKAFAQVVEALLRKQDYRAAMALLMNWLGHADHVSLEEDNFSFHALAIRWMWNWTRSAPANSAETWPLAVRFLDYLEANAEDFWQVPALFQDEPVPPENGDPDDDIFDAAYEGVTFQDSADDDQEGSVLEGSALAEKSSLEAETDQLGPRLRFLSTSARLWQLAARLDAGAEPDEKRRETLSAWLTAAERRLAQLGKLLDALQAHPVAAPLGSYESVVDYDRRRLVKEQLLHTAIAAALDTWNACLALAGAVGRAAGEPENADAGLPWQAEAVALERSLLRGDREKAAERLTAFMERFQGERLLYTALADGGEPRQILRARLAQSLLRRLALALPRLGLIREAFHLLKMVQVLEQINVGGRKGITEFNELFRAAYQGTVEAALATALSARAEQELDVVSLLEGLTRPFLQMWIDHSQTLQLSAMESFAGDDAFAPLAAFVQEYGGELFHAKFLTLANLRGILHRGVDVYLDSLSESEDANAAPRLVHDLGGKLRRGDVVRWMTGVLQAIVENYEEYKDYNTTTPQSDYGENLYLLLDFLRLKSAYDRQAWRLKPLFLAHETLARKGQAALALAWQSAFTGLTEELSGQFVERLNYLEQKHGIRLRTVADRIGEQFTRPLALDRVCALVEPAMAGAGPEGASPAFDNLVAAIEPLASNPSGVGLDVPHWLRRLEAEVERIRSRATHAGTLPEDTLRVERAVLTVDELRRQLESWDTPLLGQPPPSSSKEDET
ncbi:MAG TPA: hypothetical protein VGP68_02890 [Gemmataceae bacterium]|nr:hypothetical protein [Gemmataceae bacterium]